ncbi:MAG TPA: nitronate monooxygenase [Smithellaceae bacterium]|nr:nitronate monooxygenase [Syntrophaceae bacterium]NMC90313.1 nitronate monooxygenase [Smithella sp.]HNV56723.1 nitronate monooxygenase [Smithellaceae bacterium]MBP8666225.1 nitronate monooxygenase [Syntrophaceae bacterium]MBP9531384.1 nitronate monooxygenase [Syntrophaceae bacterium]
MIQSRLCKMIGIKYPIIQAGMGPFSNNNLCVAAANAGVLGLLSTSGLFNKNDQPWIYKAFVESGEAGMDDDMATVMEKVLKRTYRLVRDKGGIFGINVMVSAEVKPYSTIMIDTAIRVREENPDMKNNFKVIFTSAGDPVGWKDKIKGAGFTWMHVVPSVKGALRCKKAGVDVIVASGHEGGFHTSWEPVHSMILLPAVVDAVSDENTLVVGAGGFCDGRTLAAALVLGADGAQMGTRFLATKESDFHQIWKEGVVAAQDRGTLVARGFVGPARWLKTPRSEEHAQNTLKKSPGVFLGTPDDYSSMDMSLIEFEIESIKAVYEGDREKALMAAGEVAQRINDMPTVNDMVQGIVRDAEATLRSIEKKHLA